MFYAGSILTICLSGALTTSTHCGLHLLLLNVLVEFNILVMFCSDNLNTPISETASTSIERETV